MKSNSCYPWLALAVILGGPIAASAASTLTDLGALTRTGLANPGGNGVRQTYIVDLSKDGKLAGGTDASGNAFIWTEAGGQVALGAGYTLIGVDWFTGGTVLAAANNWGATPFLDASPPAYVTGAAGSFQATLNSTGDPQFYRIRRL